MFLFSSCYFKVPSIYFPFYLLNLFTPFWRLGLWVKILWVYLHLRMSLFSLLSQSVFSLGIGFKVNNFYFQLEKCAIAFWSSWFVIRNLLSFELVFLCVVRSLFSRCVQDWVEVRGEKIYFQKFDCDGSWYVCLSPNLESFQPLFEYFFSLALFSLSFSWISVTWSLDLLFLFHRPLRLCLVFFSIFSFFYSDWVISVVSQFTDAFLCPFHSAVEPIPFIQFFWFFF